MRLRDLEGEATQSLVTALFGGAERSGRLARFLHERTGGNPGECLLLARFSPHASGRARAGAALTRRSPAEQRIALEGAGAHEA